MEFEADKNRVVIFLEENEWKDREKLKSILERFKNEKRRIHIYFRDWDTLDYEEEADYFDQVDEVIEKTFNVGYFGYDDLFEADYGKYETRDEAIEHSKVVLEFPARYKWHKFTEFAFYK